MKAVVLAAGAGTRMWPLATASPKHLLPIGGFPIITFGLRALAAAGIKEVVIVCGFKGDMIETALGDGADYGLRLQYLRQRSWSGTASAINLASDAMNDEPFLAMYGDLLISRSAVSSVIAKGRESSKVVGVVQLDKSEASEYGVVEQKRGQLTRLVEKPSKKLEGRPWVNGGVYVLDGDIFRSIKKTSRSARNEYELTTSLQQQIDVGQRIETAEIAREDWMDIGRPWDLLEANKRTLKNTTQQLKGKLDSGAVVEGPVALEENAVIKAGCFIEGPAYIGKNCTVGPNSRIRPYTSLSNDVHIGASCEIKNSIIMPGSKIPHLSYIGDSVIEDNCNLAAGTITANIRLDDKPIMVKFNRRTVSSGRRKLGAIVGREAQTGINTSLMPGVRIGPNSFVGPGVVLYEDLPAGHEVFLRQSLHKVRKRRVGQGSSR